MFIVNFTVADYLTLTGFAGVWGAIWAVLSDRPELAIGILMIAALIDGLDGKVARGLGVARPFGRYLGGFVDFLNYGVCPPLVLWALGFDTPLSLAVLTLYSTCALLRLSRFNEIGNIQDSRGDLAYLGMPVFWIHFAVVGLYAIDRVLGPTAFQVATPLALLGLGFCYVLDRTFWKPKSPATIVVPTVTFAVSFLWLGMRAP